LVNLPPSGGGNPGSNPGNPIRFIKNNSYGFFMRSYNHNSNGRERMIMEAYPYVMGVAVMMAKTFPIPGMNMDDYKSVANERIMICAEKYCGPEGKFKHYAARTVRNAIFSIKRTGSRRNVQYPEELTDDDNGMDFPDRKASDPARAAELREELQRIRTIIGEETFLMFRLFSENNSYEEIGNLLSMPEGTIASRLCRARERLIVEKMKEAA